MEASVEITSAEQEPLFNYQRLAGAFASLGAARLTAVAAHPRFLVRPANAEQPGDSAAYAARP